MLKHKNSIFLFYDFNGFLNRINRPVQLVRHTSIADNDYALAILQEKIWPYFIERILKISRKNSLEIESLGTATIEMKVD